MDLIRLSLSLSFPLSPSLSPSFSLWNDYNQFIVNISVLYFCNAAKKYHALIVSRVSHAHTCTHTRDACWPHVTRRTAAERDTVLSATQIIEEYATTLTHSTKRFERLLYAAILFLRFIVLFGDRLYVQDSVCTRLPAIARSFAHTFTRKIYFLLLFVTIVTIDKVLSGT